MLQLILRLFLYLSVSSLSAILVGNPAQPGLLTQSILPIRSSWGSFRLGYLSDWIYEQHFADEFVLAGTEQKQSNMEFSTYAALLTFNLKDRLDLYGIIGSSRMQLDQEIFTKRALSWGVGGKLILFKQGNFFLGTDAKYFTTDQKPKFFIIDGMPYNIVSQYRFNYYEIQGAVGLSYRASIFVPYANLTYIYAKAIPEPPVLFVRLPDVNETSDTELSSIVGQDRWGVALGLTLVDCAKMSLSVEWRGFNENGVNVNGEIRF